MNNIGILNANKFKNPILIFLFFLLGAALPSSAALINVSLALMLLGSFFWVPKKTWIDVMTHPVVVISITIFLSLILHQLISDHPGGWKLVSKYKKWAYIPLLSPLFFLYKDKIKFLLYGFCGVNTFILLLSLIVWVSGISLFGIDVDNPTVFRFHITQNFFMAIYCVMMFYFGMRLCGYARFAMLFLSCLAFLNVIFCVQGRTGYIAMLAAMLVAPIIFVSTRKLVFLLFVTLLGVVGLSFTDNSAVDRIKLGVQESKLCISSQSYSSEACASSMGLRLFYWASAVDKIKENPLFGYGPSESFIPVFIDESIGVRNNPHNEYLMQGVQLGIYGIVLFIAINTIAAVKLIALRSKGGKLGLVILSMYLVSNLFNSFVNDFAEGTLYMVFFIVLVAYTSKENKREHPVV